MMNNEQFDHLIGLLYEATLDPTLMNEALRFCGQLVNATHGVFLRVDKKGDKVSVLQETGFSSHYGNGYLNQTINIDETLTMLRDATVNEWRCGFTLAKNAVDRRKHYQDSSSYPNTHHVMTAWIDNNGDRGSLLALFRPLNQQSFNHDDQLLAQRVGSHFQRALHMQRLAQDLRTRNEISDRAIDALSLSMIIVNDKGVILHLNANAERLLNNQTYGLAFKNRGGYSIPFIQSTTIN